MKVNVRPELKIVYPGAVFGCLAVIGAANMRQYEVLEDEKRRLEKRIREEDSVVKSYGEYFAKWGKTYPIQYQIRSIKSGKTFPRVSALVDCMFMAELKNRVLTSGHDQDAMVGTLVFDLADEGETYAKLGGESQALEKGDIVLRDGEGVLASVLYGPARRTSIGGSTRNPLYLAWCPGGVEVGYVRGHLADIVGYLGVAYGEVTSEAACPLT
jgi:DNA/RNA-binding domain of Phe-tRNA-synthetase-like protein